MLAKRADLRWRRTEQQLAEMAVLQGELLEAAAGLLAPGGVLVYGTCTTEPEETTEQIASFLAKHPEFSVEGPPAWLQESVNQAHDKVGCRVGGGGVDLARM